MMLGTISSFAVCGSLIDLQMHQHLSSSYIRGDKLSIHLCGAKTMGNARASASKRTKSRAVTEAPMKGHSVHAYMAVTVPTK